MISLWPYLVSFLSSYIFVLLKSVQQLNVVHKQYLLVIPTSLLMATAEVAIMASVVKYGWGLIVLAVGLGGGLGACTGIYTHGKWMSKHTK